MSAIPHSTLDRFWAKVQKTDTCWLWTAAKHPKGYGNFWHAHTMVKAHRFSYELSHGPIPEGLQIDHLCRVRHCVNPAHLEAVTNQENIIRGEGFAGRQSRQTHCIHGHPFSEGNMYIRNDGARICKMCQSERSRKYYLRKKEQTQ